MKKLISTTVGLVALGIALSAGTASARDLTGVSWGGNYQDAQREIYFKPFAEKSGKPVLEESWDGGYGVIAAKMETVPANCCLLYTSPSPRDLSTSRMPSSA